MGNFRRLFKFFTRAVLTKSEFNSSGFIKGFTPYMQIFFFKYNLKYINTFICAARFFKMQHRIKQQQKKGSVFLEVAL